MMFVPATPKSELKRKYQDIVSKSKIPIKVVEKTGTTVKQHLQKSDPLGSRQCADKDHCMVCLSGGSNCRREGINYEITCDKCGAVYHGESGRNGYTRGLKHQKELENKSKQSVMLRHTNLCHSEDDTPPTYKMKITSIHGGDATIRQVTEGVKIFNSADSDKLINNKSEWTSGSGIVGCALTRT